MASEDEALALRLQEALNSAVFRVYVNGDPLGVELCAAAKNVIALAAGGIDGLGLGDNAKAALITRGLAEMARLGEAAGADPETFAGLAGHGRPDRHLLAPERPQPPRGRADRARPTPEEAAAEIGQVVEGLTTAPVLRDLSHRLGVELPLTEASAACSTASRCTSSSPGYAAPAHGGVDDTAPTRAGTIAPVSRSP